MAFDSARPLRVRSQLEFCLLAAALGCALRLRRPGLGAPRLRAPLRLQPKGHGAVVDQRDLHVGPENAACDPRVPAARRHEESLVQAPS